MPIVKPSNYCADVNITKYCANVNNSREYCADVNNSREYCADVNNNNSRAYSLSSSFMNNDLIITGSVNDKCWTEVSPSKYTQKKLSLVLTPGGVNAILSSGYNKSNGASSSWVNPKKFMKLSKVSGVRDTGGLTFQNRDTFPVRNMISQRSRSDHIP